MKIRIPEMIVELNEKTLEFLESQNLNLVVEQTGITKPASPTDALQHEEPEPEKEPKNGYKIFEAAFDEFVKNRRGAFAQADIREHFEEKNIPWVEGYYNYARKRLMGLGLNDPMRLDILDPEAANSQRKYIKRRELLAMREGERRVKEGIKKPDSVMIQVDPAPF